MFLYYNQILSTKKQGILSMYKKIISLIFCAVIIQACGIKKPLQLPKKEINAHEQAIPAQKTNNTHKVECRCKG